MSIFSSSQLQKTVRHTYYTSKLWLIASLFTASWLLTSCAYQDDAYDDAWTEAAESDSTGNAPSFTDSATATQAEAALADRQIRRAQHLYADWLANAPNSGQAAAGLAITDLLLLLDSAPVTELLTQHLGAKHAIDSTDIIYGSDGILYWLSRGVSWENQGQYQGISSLIEHKLPWTKQQLQSITTFVEGLNSPINLLIPDLISIAELIHNIEKNLQSALDDPYFKKIYIPGEIFHDSRLSLTLAHSELALIQSALAAVRAAIHFVAAFQHDWTLENAFGIWRRAPTESDDAPLYIPAFGAEDYSFRYLDQHLFREVTRPEQLNNARAALADSLKHALKSSQYGISTENDYVLQWNDIIPAYLNNVMMLLKAVESALFLPTELPFTIPPTRADFSPLFTGQKYLDSSIPWMIRIDQQNNQLPDDSTAEGSWIFNPDAQQAFLLDDIYNPIPQNEQLFPALQINEPGQFLLKPLLKNYIEQIKDTYLLAR